MFNKTMKFIAIIAITLTTVNASSYFTIHKNECIRKRENYQKELKQCQIDVAHGIYALTNIPCADNKALDLDLYLSTKRKKCVNIEILTDKVMKYDTYEESCEASLFRANHIIIKSIDNCRKVKQKYEEMATLNFCPIGTSLNWDATAETSSPLSQTVRGPQCFVCGEDHFRTKEMSKCFKCPAGYIAMGDKNDKCSLCTEKMFKNNECERPSEEFCNRNYKLANYEKYTNNVESCVRCNKPGTFIKYINQNIECDQCEDGYIYKRFKCIPCPIGSFQQNNVCIQCPVKTFNNKIGNNVCYEMNDTCPSDSRANFAGATHCGSETYIEKAQRLWYITIIMMFFVYANSFTGI